ncbi:putative MccF-like protein (microcin C7 resistance) [Salinarchaeum sp. Harcht-Bsk1]|uniref:S66 family peptidase n=1 Tax=Salinarchaeum sp. Harcht-Bsk1 TaxID=1333523 RepID=UPI0003423A78|nr:S66 peptidase family protein [Salinarchaeum sp. Harcht-Bsk1]AGN02503.1 putative MccF-like protein (microcin C7 resistance) [Salinarchaeum sp. Harcht-Bsk1]
MPEFVTPPPLERGDRVAIVAPSSGIAAAYPHVYELGLERLRTVFDLEPVEYPTATKDDEYLAAHPAERAGDVVDAFRDPEIGGVVTTIGGSDQLRILEHLDPAVLREHPTRFYGISDNANLTSYLWNEGVVSYYGGSVMTTLAMQGSMSEYSVEYLERAFFEESIGEIEPADRFTDQDLDWADPDTLDQRREFEDNPGWRWAGGDEPADGRVWGGCLDVLVPFLAADRYAPEASDLEGCVLLLEPSEELPSAEEVRMALLAMGERGILDAIDGVLVGRAKARSPWERPGPEERAAYRERQRETIETIVGEYNPEAPIVFDVEVGHTAPTVPVPIGGRAVVDPVDERITFP